MLEPMSLRTIDTFALAPMLPIRLRCPGCKDRVALEGIPLEQDVVFGQADGPGFHAGQRVCPNPDCRTHLFVAYESRASGAAVLSSYPQEVLDFDPSGLPDKVLAAFEEAVTCHANQCWVAAAMMVRKTLEELCSDHEIATGNLKDKIQKLESKVVLPKQLIEGLDALRLLGNDAAHIESRDYEKVGQEEVEIAIDVAKEILKATYQMDTIVARLTALKRQRDAAPN